MSKGIPKGSLVISVPPELRERAVAALSKGPLNVQCAIRIFLWALAEDPQGMSVWLMEKGASEVSSSPPPAPRLLPLLKKCLDKRTTRWMKDRTDG